MKTIITKEDVQKAQDELVPNRGNLCSCCVLYQALKRLGLTTPKTKVWGCPQAGDSKDMNATETIQYLRALQSQIIHGGNTWGEAADLIEKQEQVRLNALNSIGHALDKIRETHDACEFICKAHRILASGEPDGDFKAEVENSVRPDIGYTCGACECIIHKDGCGCNPHGA